jgi:hypothetical protein
VALCHDDTAQQSVLYSAGTASQDYRNAGDNIDSSHYATTMPDERACNNYCSGYSAPSTCEKGQKMLAWVRAQGGYVHPNLAVQAQASYGTRGVVAHGPIRGDEPTYVVPLSLCMTSQAAKTKYGALFAREPAFELLAPTAQPQLAIMLAIEKCIVKHKSFWYPYIAALPDKLSCTWGMDADKVATASADLRRRFPSMDVAGMVQADKESAEWTSQITAEVLRQHMPGISAADMLWAMGQVMLPLQSCARH